MGHRVHTVHDVLRLAESGATELLVALGERLTPMARDIAREHGVRVVETTDDDRPVPAPAGPGGTRSPRLHHVAAVHTRPLELFPVDLRRPEMDVRALDVLGAREGLPMAAGVMTLREGTFPWDLDYDELQYVIEGELHISTADQRVVGRPGDLIAVAKGCSITFGTPSWAKFLYVTYPADWEGGA